MDPLFITVWVLLAVTITAFLIGSPHGVSTPEAYTSLAKGQAEVADNYLHLP